jgi:catechol 2,3-dioxygenase-like lactoylglutathione lyase family enzyme
MRILLSKRLLALVLTLWLALAQAAHGQAGATSRAPLVQAVGAISMTVADLDRSVAFYSRVLSFEKASDQKLPIAGAVARVAHMKLGDESIDLVEFKGKQGRAVPADSRSNDRWFQHIAIIVSDMDRAYGVLRANKVEPASVAPQRLPDWNKNAAGIRAFYFTDPDGHPLEILQFPEGKGDPKWHSKNKLFLGIDHTAIVVSDTNASLEFYRDRLGFRIVGESENYGPEQERLNNVPGARLRITTLRAEQGPGIELLEYLAPRNGRDLPFEASITDIVHRHTTLIARHPKAVAKALLGRTDAHFVFASSALPASDGLFVRDPDGHELLVRADDVHEQTGEMK